MNSEKIKIIKKSDEAYPKILKEISRPPEQLYIRGTLPKDSNLNIAIVGTRAATAYGRALAFNMAKELAGLGFNIVSGMALGIDTEAHKGALEAGGITVAVLGSGLDEKSLYPGENKKLADKIVAAGGAVISEYAPGTRGTNWTFPERNRIVSGLSRGVIVVEAPSKSGALITARLAAEQNREVFAMPGPLYSKNSAGPNELIKNGAKMVTSVDDILEELNLVKLKKEKVKAEKENLSPEEKIIVSAIENEPVEVDKICQMTKIPVKNILSTISLLEIKGIIKSIGGKFVKIT